MCPKKRTTTRPWSAVLPVTDLRWWLGAVLPHIATHRHELPALTAARVTSSGGWLYASATDRYTLGVARTRAEEAPGGVDVLVPLAGVKAILSTHRANRRGESRSVIVTVSSDRLTVAALPGDGAPAVSVGVDTLGLEPVALESVLRQDATPTGSAASTRVTLNPLLLARFAAAGQPAELVVAPDRMAAVQVTVGEDFRGAIQPYNITGRAAQDVDDGWGEGIRTLGKRGAR